jgi:hypothetical protein
LTGTRCLDLVFHPQFKIKQKKLKATGHRLKMRLSCRTQKTILEIVGLVDPPL